MPGATVGAAPAHHHPTAEQASDPVVRGSDRLLDAVIVVMATWTLVYHLCFLLRLGSDVALLIEVVLLAAVLGAIATRRRHEPQGAEPEVATGPRPTSVSGPSASRTRPGLLWTVVAAAGIATVAMALQLPWLLVWVAWLVAAGAGTMLALTRADRADRGADAFGPPSPMVRAESWVVVAMGLALAVLSLVIVRGNPDDLFYVNLSQWVAAHGTFPHRDTIYADLTYPISNWPPLASYDAGTGAVAHLLGVHAATIVYIVVPPIATALSVLALWRLLRTWRVQHVLVALAAAVVFLMSDGTSAYGPPGNLWVTRLWQGKVVLLCVVVPVLLVMALRYVEAPSRRRAAWAGVGGIAAVACSTTAVFLVPVVALAGAAPLLRRSPRRGAVLFASMSAYPLLMGVVTKAVGGRSADDFAVRRQYRFDPSWFGHAVFLDGVVAVVGVAAVLLGCLLVPHHAARVTTAAAATLTGITFVPGVTHVGYDLVGLGPTLWRLTWSLSVAALVGAAASYAVTWLKSRSSSRRLTVGAPVVAGVVATGLLLGLGHPILAADTTTTFAAPGHWQRSPDSIRASRWILAHTEPGDRVLAPDGLAITVAVTTTEIKTVTPRDYYMYYLRDDPRFDYDQRLTVTEFVNNADGWDADQVVPALQTLDVRVACVYRIDHVASALLHAAGWTGGTVTDSYRCLVAPREVHA